MLIRSLYLENFRQFRDSQEIDLSVDWGSDQNIVLLGGLNGSGKTSLLIAIRLALFGKQNTDLWRGRSYKSFIRQCLNHQAEADGHREFQLHIDLATGDVLGSSTLRVERRWKFNDAGDFQGEALQIFGNGKEQLGFSQEEAELFIQERVSYGVTNFVFFDGERIQELSRQDLFEFAVQDEIRDILGLRLYQELEQDLWSYERSLLRDHTDSDELRAVESALERNEGQRDELELRKAELQKGLAQAEAELGDIRAERKRLGDRHLLDRSAKNQQLQQLRAEREVLQLKLSNLLSNGLRMVILRPLLSKLKQRLRAEVLAEREAIVADLLEGKKQRLLGALQRLAPDTDVSSLTAAWEQVFERGDRERPLLHRNLSLDQKCILVDHIEATQTEAVQHVEPILKGLDSVEHKIRKVQLDLRSLPTDIVYLEQEAKEKQAIDSVRSYSEQLGVLSVEDSRLKHERGTLERRYQAVSRRIETSAEIERKLTKARLIREAAAEFIQRLAAAKTTEVQNYLTRMFLRISRKEKLIREFRVDSATFAITLVDDDNRERDLQNLSEGEKEVFAISFLWAMSQAAVQELPIVMDSVFGRLDSVHRGHIAERFLPEANRQIIVLVTDTEINADMYDRLKPYIAKAYHLEYDDSRGGTAVVSGYLFEEVGNRVN